MLGPFFHQEGGGFFMDESFAPACSASQDGTVGGQSERLASLPPLLLLCCSCSSSESKTDGTSDAGLPGGEGALPGEGGNVSEGGSVTDGSLFYPHMVSPAFPPGHSSVPTNGELRFAHEGNWWSRGRTMLTPRYTDSSRRLAEERPEESCSIPSGRSASTPGVANPAASRRS